MGQGKAGRKTSRHAVIARTALALFPAPAVWPQSGVAGLCGQGPRSTPGTHALYLSRPHSRIHGTNDTRKIGRKSSNGCIGLYNEQIAELFALAKVGTQVKLI